MELTRFPRSVYGRGTEPDPRFSLANERTFLAWIRTSLALVATGVALEALKVPSHSGLRRVAALVFVVLGLLAAAQGWSGWVRAERSLRLKRPLPGPTFAPMATVGMLVAAGLVAVALLQ